MPLGSENPSLARRAIAGLRTESGRLLDRVGRGGAMIPRPVPIAPGGYSPGAAAVNAATSFMSGARAAGNYRLASERARQQGEYQRAQTEHIQAETRKLNTPAETYSLDIPAQEVPGAPLPAGISGPSAPQTIAAQRVKFTNPNDYSQERARWYPQPTPESASTQIARESLDIRRRAETRLEGITSRGTTDAQRIAALRVQEQGIDTEDQRLLSDADARAQMETETVMNLAATGDPRALDKLGITKEQFDGFGTPESRLANIRYQGMVRSRALQQQYRTTALARNAGRRGALQSEVGRYSGFQVPSNEGGDIMQQFRDLARQSTGP